ncbi:MAG: DNA polymerase III subunit epsilon [Puniceicoccaceae bacterium 5H]|nr:MAG: DNA polymerase III subunit epsilon [Puniceicoccaceae bacterium 5H]
MRQLPPIHVIDFEGHPRYGVIEYGVATVEAGRVTAAATRLCAPTGDIPPADTQVHGLRAQNLTGCAPFADEYQRFVAWRSSGVLAAHNSWVEHRLLKHHWSFPPFVPAWATEGEVAEWGPWLCTLRLARVCWPELESHSVLNVVSAHGLEGELDALAQRHCPPERDRAHCALYDALASALVLCRALDELAGQPHLLNVLLEPENWLRSGAQQAELF